MQPKHKTVSTLVMQILLNSSRVDFTLTKPTLESNKGIKQGKKSPKKQAIFF